MTFALVQLGEVDVALGIDALRLIEFRSPLRRDSVAMVRDKGVCHGVKDALAIRAIADLLQ